MRKIYRIIQISLDIIISLLPYFISLILYRALFNSPSYFAYAARSVVIKRLIGDCHSSISIAQGVIIKAYKKLHIGKNVTINERVFISAEGNCYIKDNVLIGHDVSILTSNHIFKDPNTIIRQQGINYYQVIIEEDVWIGAKATILAGVKLGKGCVIGAGSVVTHDIPENAVAVGVPARVINYRTNK